MISQRPLLLFIFLVSHTAASALYGACHKSEQCGTFDSICNNGTCKCQDNFTNIFDTCVPIATPLIPCTHKNKCQSILGQKSICKEQRCVCKSFHHLHNNQCIKSRSLDEMCDSDHHCYCGQGCSDKIHCLKRICTCKHGFKRDSRRCIRDPAVILENKEKQHVEKLSSSGQFPIYSIKILIIVLFFVKIL